MQKLPVSDFRLMTEHLVKHKGMINKLGDYEEVVQHPTLKHIIGVNKRVMESHVEAMILFINPEYNEPIHLSPVEPFDLESLEGYDELESCMPDQLIVPNLIQMTERMSNTNHQSALKMRHKNVRTCHIEMALQQETLNESYCLYAKQMGWANVSDTVDEIQLEAYEYFQNMYYG
ncbi:hypothetical protein [Aquibacillus kalidii]|uniref:hypothetical protein n=1 Tax=Aquibacillus kalidii TaxID=2762597 RepID=UPI0016471966|nr:hypothetical protein [Aquibacillus kalidii]